MIPPAPSKILVGISLDPDHSIELLSWATRVLAQSNDTIVAIHVRVGEESKKGELIKKKQWQIRQAKAHVISVLGEFARTCQSKQARVGFSSGIARALTEEAKSFSADYLLLQLYCFEHAPETCTVLSLGKCEPQKNSANIRENLQPSSRWLNGNTRSGSTSSTIENHINSETERHNSSPRTVLHQLEAESHSTEDDTCSLGDLSTTVSPPLATNINGHSKNQISTCKLISSIFASPMRKGNRIFLNKEKKQSTLLKCFTYEEIASATNDFHPDNIVGRCGYSEVYRGDLSDGRTIAVKMLAKENRDAYKEKEFLMELGIIGHVCHPNTANLLGCCVENGLYLIFNFSQNGNLASALRGKTGESLQWPVRYKIALGVARGLHYLHKCCKHRIINTSRHKSLQCSSRITDFGLAKWLPNKVTHHAVIPIEGTFGYLAPEYFMHGIVDEKTDVFAFGVLLLEIITGRRPVDSTQQNLLLWAKPLMESGNITELADRPELEGKFDSDQVQRVVLTASYCVRQSSTWRPSMSEVLELLTSGHDSEVARSWRMPRFTPCFLDTRFQCVWRRMIICKQAIFLFPFFFFFFTLVFCGSK
ncbi:receptor serine/threonine-protein kinase [Salix suchowensis]|nr:receptor serine/threonine-protein kinase [Salix suchowensis]